MAGTRRGIYIEFIGDEIKYVRSAENVLKTNTTLGTSFKKVGVDAKLSAEAQVAAAVKAQEAMRVQALNLRGIANTSTGQKRVQASRLAAAAEAQLAASYGISTRASKEFSQASQRGERDLNKLARGALAGSGLFAVLGRSLAFASSGFIAFAVGATLIRKSYDAATQLLATQRAVDAQLKTQGATWGQYGQQINDTDLKLSHISGFTNRELLQSFEYLDRVTGNVNVALRLQAVAADVARGRNIPLANAALALGKAYGGSLTALRRLGIVVPKALKGMDALNYVGKKFAGQAAANATVAQKFNATLIDAEEIIGTALLPTINKYLTNLGDWLAKMNESGRLQKDVNTVIRDAGDVFHTLGFVIRRVDDVTGSFANTIKVLVGLRLAVMVGVWVGALKALATQWGIVEVAATRAATAEKGALGSGALAAAGGGAAGGGAISAVEAGAVGVAAGALGGKALSYRTRANLPKVFSSYAGGEAGVGIAEVGVAATLAGAKVMALRGALARLGGIGTIPIAIAVSFIPRATPSANPNAPSQNPTAKAFAHVPFLGPYFSQGNRLADYLNGKLGITQPPSQPSVNPPPLPSSLTGPRPSLPSPFGPTGMLGAAINNQPLPPFSSLPGAHPFKQWAKFQLTYTEKVTQAQAQLTSSLTDDAAAAKTVIARIKKLIAGDKLKPKALLEALQIEAAAIGTVQSAADAAAQKRKDAADKAKQIAESYEIPMNLQIAQAYAALTTSTSDDIRVYKQIIVAARKTLASGKKKNGGIVALLDTIKQAQDAIQAAQQSQFEEPMKLRVALAREQALGLDTAGTLAKMKSKAMKALRSGKFTGDALIALYEQITSLNEQLGASPLGSFKQANIAKLTGHLGLTRAQRKALEGRLSQLGPKGTVPSSGVGGAGYAINPKTDRPLVIHNTVKLDGRVVARNTTVHQQRTRKRNPKQRRGPNAGAAAA